jgi:predicted lipoprotein with Yx(FWY)xxD motif
LRRFVLAACLASLTMVALGIAAFGSGSGSRAAGPQLKLRSTAYGEILVNGQGQTLYAFGRDGPRQSRCHGSCARAWPPFVVGGEPRTGAGVAQRLLGTIRRPNGELQVSYRGKPLYFYAPEGPRQVLCQNVSEFGGLWLVVNARGSVVR